MIIITAVPLNYFQYKITCTSRPLLKKLKKTFSTIQHIKFRTKVKKKLIVTQKVIKLYTEDKADPTAICLRAGYIDYFLSFISKLDNKEVKKEITVLKAPVKRVNKKWEKVLRDYQLDITQKLLRYNCGLADVYTGAGKTETLLAILESLNEISLIIVPSNSIKEEIILRAKKYDVPLSSKFDSSAKFNIINSLGFLRSKLSKESKVKKWLSKVKLVIGDEVHHLSANSNLKLFDSYLKGAQYSYGFSASPDVTTGKILTPAKSPLDKMDWKCALLLGLTGSVKKKISPPTDVTLIKLYKEISAPVPKTSNGNFFRSSEEEFNWRDSLDEFAQSKKLAATIATLIRKNYPKFSFYIPVHTVESGLILTKHLNKVIPTMFWSSGYLYPEELNVKGQDELVSVKDAITKKGIQVLVSTTVGFEGVDIPKLDGIIPIHGTNFRMIVQPIGRSSRQGTVTIILIYDTNNPLVMSQMRKRFRTIKQSYKIGKTQTIKQ